MGFDVEGCLDGLWGAGEVGMEGEGSEVGGKGVVGSGGEEYVSEVIFR